MDPDFFEDLPELAEGISEAIKKEIDLSRVVIWIFAIVIIIGIATW